jgi:hypothetical protein
VISEGIGIRSDSKNIKTKMPRYEDVSINFTIGCNRNSNIGKD